MNERRGNGMVLDRTDLYGDGCVRYGVLHMVDVYALKGAGMKLVIAILILTVIIWWPRKGEGG